MALIREPDKNLNKKECKPCSGKTPPLKAEEIRQLAQKLPNGWEIIEDKKLQKRFKFRNFKEALAFTNKVGDVAESQQHHPDILLSWGKVNVSFMTHKIDGLSENDFIMAAKVDCLTLD